MEEKSVQWRWKRTVRSGIPAGTEKQPYGCSDAAGPLVEIGKNCIYFSNQGVSFRLLEGRSP